MIPRPSHTAPMRTVGQAFASCWPKPIQRSQTEVRAFRAENPCPSNGKTRGACAGWSVDPRQATLLRWPG